MKRKLTIIVNDQDFSIRVDRYLSLCYPFLTQGIIQKSLRNGDIIVNNLKCHTNFRLQNDDQISIEKFLINTKFETKDKAVNLNAIPLADKLLSKYLIYQDENLIAINKPPKLATQGGTKIQICVDDALCYLNREFNYNLRLVHRLDKDTSGIMLIAKNRNSAIKLTQAFKQQEIKKTYLSVIVYDGLLKQQGTIENIINDGKYAITNYEVLKYYDNKLALVRLIPHTGRTHQLRQHVMQIGGSVLGDKKYSLATNIKSEYLMLHAHKIHIPDTVFNKTFDLIAPLPEYFQKYIHDPVLDFKIG